MPERDQTQDFVFDYWPTGQCDMQCPFCYGAQVPDFAKYIPSSDGQKKVNMYSPSAETILLTSSIEPRPELDLDQSKQVLRLMRSVGGSIITVAGGEPLLRPETPRILSFAKQELGMIVYLSTDGSFVLNRYPEFNEQIDVMGLPLDGSSIEINERMGRRPYLYNNIRKILGYFREFPPSHIVKVGTVMSKINYDDIANIGRLLFRNPELRSPDVWRLYQFEKIGRGEQNANDYYISNDEFEAKSNEIVQLFPEIDIRPRSNETHLNAYFFVTPDGMLQVVDSSHHVSIADLTSMSTDNLTSLITNYQLTISRANENRDWLETPRK